MNKTNIITLLAIIGVLILASSVTYVIITTPHDSVNSKAQESLSTSPEQVFTDLQGNPIQFTDYEGKVRVVNSWASWTPFSVQELKDLEMLATEYASKDVVVLAINRKEQKEHAIRFLESIGTFRKIIFAIDLSDSFYASIGGFAMPETIFYDAKGNIIFHKRGSMNFEEMKLYTEKALGAIE